MTKVLGTKLSTLWTRINTVLVPRQATVTTTGSYHIVTLQNAVTPTPDALVSFSIPANSGGSGDTNQNAFSNVKVGSSTISATAITDTLSVTAGSNISLSVNSKTLTISAPITSATITSALGYTPYSVTNPNGYTSNTGTVTGVKINNSTKTPSSGVVDIGTVLTTFTESDPIFSGSAAAGITAGDITNWNGKTSNIGTVTAVKINNTTKTASSGIVDLGTIVTNAVTSVNSKTGAITITAGDNVSINSSSNTITISVTGMPSAYTLPIATTLELGGVRVDDETIIVDESGYISAVTPTPYTLPIASTDSLGGVMIDDNTITIDSNGVISGVTYAVFGGADDNNAGESGLVPTPTAGEDYYILFGDGNWYYPSVSLSESHIGTLTRLKVTCYRNSTSFDTKTVTLSAASASYDGLMSASDKIKLDAMKGIAVTSVQPTSDGVQLWINP